MPIATALKDLSDIYLVSCKIGALTFGGGYAMLPILQKEVVEKRQWNTEAEILDYYALAQCLPGIIMVNTLIFVGHSRRKKAGALAGALGAVTPSLIIILIIASLLTNFADVPAVQNAFAGIRVCVCVLILNSVLKLWKSSVVDSFCLALFGVIGTASLYLDLSPVIYVIIAAVLGILKCTVLKKKGGAA